MLLTGGGRRRVRRGGLCVDLFGFERFHEAFGLAVIEGLPGRALANGDVAIDRSSAVGHGGVLHAAIGAMDQAGWCRSSRSDRLLQRGGIESIFESLADDLARERVENDGEIAEGFGEMN